MSKKFYKKLRKDIMTHDCTFPPEESPIILFVNSGVLVYFRRWVRRMMLVSEQNPRSMNAFLSKAAYRRERERHLQYYYWVIHPFSDFKLYWETFLLYFTGIYLLAISGLVYCDHTELWEFIIAKFCAEIIYILDILMNFNSGYHNKQTNEVILKRKKIAKHYLKTRFVCDFISTINFDFALIQREKTIFYLKFFNFSRMLKIFTFLKYLNHYREVQKFSMYKFSFIKIVLITILVIAWFTNLLFLLTTLYEEEWLGAGSHVQHSVSCLYRVTYLFFLIGYGEGGSEHSQVLMFEIFCWLVGVAMKFFVISEMVQIVSKYNASGNKYQRRVQRLTDFMNHKGLTETTCKRIFQYFDFRFQKSYYSEEEVASTLSSQLQQEIMLQTCKRLIENVNIFKDLPTAILTKMVACLKSVIFLPNDVIVQAGTVGECMFFIYNGTVAVYTSKGFEICHLTDGSNFGEVVLVMPEEPRIATVIAVDSCELYSLSRQEFQKVIGSYPDLYNRICKIAQQRFAQAVTNKSTSALSVV